MRGVSWRRRLLIGTAAIVCMSASRQRVSAFTVSRTAVARPIPCSRREQEKCASCYGRYPPSTVLAMSSVAASGIVPANNPAEVSLSPAEQKKEEKRQLIKSEGGPFTIATKIGGINPWGFYCGVVSLGLSLMWYAALTASRLLYFVTGDRVDKNRRLPVFFSHVWGVSLMTLTFSFPKMVGREKLDEFYKSNRAAMFVANHNSWLDIPFLGYTIGWRNYKMVAKKELQKIPALGAALQAGRNILVDRQNRRSQVLTLKAGFKWLKDGIHLCTFPEGTRSKTGRLSSFKGGAFLMAQKAGAPIVPISIVGSGKVMGPHWIMPHRPARGVCEVVVHDPVETDNKTEEEVVEIVKQSIIDGLPEYQRPLQ